MDQPTILIPSDDVRGVEPLTWMKSDLLTVTDLKNHAHCARFSYYEHCIPDVRPRTYKMDEGQEAHAEERARARRRNLSAFGLPAGQRVFDVRLQCDRLGLVGVVDEIVETPEGVVLPVDYKLSRRISESFRIQVAAYALLCESVYGVSVNQGYIYLISRRELHAVPLTAAYRQQIPQMLVAIRETARSEHMPPPTRSRAKCLDCEFRRFCNDV